MEYSTVFDATQRGLDWTTALVGVGFVAGGILLFVKSGAPPHSTVLTRVIAVGFIFLGVCIATVNTTIQWRERNALVSQLLAGRARVVEGVVQDFQPMPSSGHGNECFSVEKLRFCYSDFEASPAFNNTQFRGGPIRAGLHVRVHYVGLAIAKLEVAKGENPR